MNHPGEERLILYYYGEDEARAETEAHLADCGSCRDSFLALKRVLGAMNELAVPERGESYGRWVWHRVNGKLTSRRETARTVSRWLTVAAVAAMVVAAFVAGRLWRPPEPRMAAIPQAVRERILLVAVGDHLEKSQMVLIELVNARPDGPVDISGERRRAGELVEESRLYRQTALRSGDAATASVLDELERVLLEIARGPAEVSSAQLDQLRERIESGGILFKVRVASWNTRNREKKF